MKRFLIFAILIPLVTFSSFAVADTLRVGILTDGSSDFWVTLRNEAQSQVKAAGMELDFRTPAPATSAKQEELARAMIDGGVQVLAICPVRASRQVDFITALAEQIPVVTLFKDVPDSGRSLFIGRDEAAIGRSLAQLIKGSVPEGLKVQVLCNDVEQPATKERLDAFREELDDYVIVDKYLEDKGDRMLGWANVVDSIDTRPEIAAFIGTQEYHGPATLRAVLEKNRGKWVRVLSWGSDETTLKGLQDGTVQGLVVDDAQGAAKVVVQTLKTLAEKGTEALAQIEVGCTPVTILKSESTLSAEEMMNALQIQLPWMSEATSPAPRSESAGDGQAD
ncbi:MAG: substrate-binding domain-containing protein [Candidatus Hydrogenedens sp.]|jgi:ribose transport system substrate-binding protein|nr:substrate-binding domain-containing protein [Candidatus Hydrogenedens sp.]